MKPLLILIQATLAIFLVACKNHSPNQPQRVPFGIPFSFSNIEKRYELIALIDNKLDYTVRLYLHLTEPNPYSHFLDHDSPEEATKLRSITGLLRDANTGHWIDTGLPATFRVHAISIPDGAQILDELVFQPKTNNVYMGRYAVLAKIRLPPGTYKFHITCLQRMQELVPLLGRIAITEAVVSK